MTLLHPTFAAPTTAATSRGSCPAIVGITVFLASIGVSTPLLGAAAWYLRVVAFPIVIVAAWIAGRGTRPFAQIRVQLLLGLFLTWMCVAASWSQAPAKQMLEAVTLLIAVTVVAHLGAAVFDGEGLLRWQVRSVCAILAAVALYAVANPTGAFSLYQGDARWGGSTGLRAFYFHKNSLGIVVSFGIALLPAVAGTWKRGVYLGTLVVALALCNSSTSWVASACCLFGVAIVGRAASSRRQGSRGGVFLWMCAGLLAAGASFVGRNVALEVLGREPTLTGRDVIWKYSWEAARRRPIFGYGPSGFWGFAQSGVDRIQRVAGFPVPSSHQGLIDIMLDYGLVGVAFFTCLVFAAALLVVRRVLAGDAGVVTLVSFGMLVVVALSSLTEGSLLAPGMQAIALCTGLLLNDRPISLGVRQEPISVSSA